SNTFTFPVPIPVVAGTTYVLGFSSDSASGVMTTSAASGSWNSSTTYAAFPVASPSTGASSPITCSIIVTTFNASLVSETQQDGTTSYVYDAVAGHADFYNVAPLTPAPASVV